MSKQHNTGAYLRFVTLAVSFALALMLPGAAMAAPGTVTADKTLSDAEIQCGEATTVTLTVEGESGIVGNPADIMLVLDRSGSMGGAPLASLKAAANAFVDKIDEATDGALDGTIANGSRVGMVSFASTATLDRPLTTNAGDVKSGINLLSASGFTAIGDGINLAQSQLAGSNPDSTKIMVVFTDGENNRGADPTTAASNAKAAGTEIFAIGLGSVNTAQLNSIASDPDSEHVFITPDSDDLEAIFNAIGAAIVAPAATDVTVVDTVSDNFSVTAPTASKGTVNQLGNELTWEIDEIGTESVSLSFTATHDATKPGGLQTVNDSVVYSDAEGNVVSFPNPTVDVRCDPVTADDCKDGGWQDYGFDNQGRCIQFVNTGMDSRP